MSSIVAEGAVIGRRRLLQGAAGLGGGGAARPRRLRQRYGPRSARPSRSAPIMTWRPSELTPTACSTSPSACGRSAPRGRGSRPRAGRRRAVVHNYGHGGSGWSLSWGSGTWLVRKAMARNPKEVAVVGCGALGLTSAILAQEAGAKVTIYAKELLPDARSARATGSLDAGQPHRARPTPPGRPSARSGRRWRGSPSSATAATSACRAPRWSGATATSCSTTSRGRPPRRAGRAGAARFRRIHGPHRRTSRRAASGCRRERRPSRLAHVRRASQLQFNVADYAHTLMADFLAAGGRVERREFHALERPRDAEGEGRDQLPGLWRTRAVPRRVRRPGAGPDRLADPPAGGELRPLLQGRRHALAAATASWSRRSGAATCSATATTTRPLTAPRRSTPWPGSSSCSRPGSGPRGLRSRAARMRRTDGCSN